MSAYLAVSVFLFILRGVSLLGVDSVEIPMSTRARVWQGALRRSGSWTCLNARFTECSLEELNPEDRRNSGRWDSGQGACQPQQVIPQAAEKDP